jgi:protoheme IX farnesyltransferase
MATHPIPVTSGLLVRRRHVAGSAVLSDYWTITKPDVNFLIAFTTAAAFCIGAPRSLSGFPWMALLHAVIGTVMVASGAATLNQWMERGFDARMRRTARRPIAAGRMEPSHALRFGTLLSLVGVVYLAINSGHLASSLTVVTLLSYLLIYTPLKRITPLCTAVGAVPGALPPLIGWAAARGRLDSEALVLFAIVFLWQFPHFMAIAWMYRDDYDRAGYAVLPQGRTRVPFVVWQTTLPLAALVLASLLPVVMGNAGLLYGIGALCFDGAFFYYGAQFALQRTGSSARRLLLASIVYLPLLFLLLTFATR